MEKSIFPKYVKINDNDILLAIRMGMNPMKEWYDPKHHYLPYFWNYISGPQYGNSHHRSYSCVHSVGRWLDALVNAQEITGESVKDEVYEKLSYWAYTVFENSTGMMADLDLESFQWVHVCDLHNLREAMYSFAALLKKNPEDKKAKLGAEHLIDMVDRYTDYTTGQWKEELYLKECGGTIECGASSKEEVYRFSSTLGRYIGGLVRLYQVYPIEKALDQALRLTETAFRVVLYEDGEFDTIRFAEHLHSTSSMISGIAMLGSMLNDMHILSRIKKFLERGYYQVALDFGWCLENIKRKDDMVGEINNTGDYIEACLCLGKAGYSEFYERADRMIRCHLLPAQLLDVSFISDEESNDDSINHMARRMKGAFGFPCPYGHEYTPGSEISFNWDIVGGGVSSLCQAYRHIVSYKNGVISINLQFDFENKIIQYTSPYGKENTMKILLKEDMTMRILMPDMLDWKDFKEKLDRQGIKYRKHENWIYLYNLYGKGIVEIPVSFFTKTVDYIFRKNNLRVKFQGNRIIGMTSPGKRLCFFEEIKEGGDQV